MRIQPLGFILLSAASAPDVVRSRLWYRDALTGELPLTYDDAHVDIPASAVETLEDGSRKVNLSDPGISFGDGVPSDGTVNFAISDIDDAGNESDISEAVAVPFDIVAPAAPTGLSYLPA